MIAQVVAGDDGGVDTHIGGETGNGDVANAFGAQDLIESGATKCAHLNSGCQEQIVVLRFGHEGGVIGRLFGAHFPSFSQQLPAVKSTCIGPIEFAMILRVAFGHMDDPDAFFARFIDHFDRVVEHALVIIRLELGVPSAIGIDKIALKIHQNDGGF